MYLCVWVCVWAVATCQTRCHSCFLFFSPPWRTVRSLPFSASLQIIWIGAEKSLIGGAISCTLQSELHNQIFLFFFPFPNPLPRQPSQPTSIDRLIRSLLNILFPLLPEINHKPQHQAVTFRSLLLCNGGVR